MPDFRWEMDRMSIRNYALYKATGWADVFQMPHHRQYVNRYGHKIKDLNKTSNCSNAKVDEYTFQGNTVYTFDPGNCGADMAIEVISLDCNNLGYLVGITGNTKINGAEFSTATFIKTTWKK